MPKRKILPIALTIAGSDSGGGAGVQADLKTFAALGVHGASAITCVTAQNPRRVIGVQPCSPKIVRQQIEAVFEELRPGAVKTGMLFSAEIVRVVAEFFKKRNCPPLIIDPVMISTSSAVLLKPSAIKILETQLLPLATLVTPNLHEAEILTGHKLMSVEDLRVAAREIHARFGCAALVKGGHLPVATKPRPTRRDGGAREAIDIFFDGRTELLLRASFIRGIRTHGTGCTYSAAIAGYLAMGLDLPRAVKCAKEFVTQAIIQSRRIEKYFVLSHSENVMRRK
jgi:hydroxymethylpyrimidine/phosphomethylpyrimidine kinase